MFLVQFTVALFAFVISLYAIHFSITWILDVVTQTTDTILLNIFF